MHADVLFKNTWCLFYNHRPLYITKCVQLLTSLCEQAIISKSVILDDWVSCHQAKSIITLPNSEVKQSHTDVLCSPTIYIWPILKWMY